MLTDGALRSVAKGERSDSLQKTISVSGVVPDRVLKSDPDIKQVFESLMEMNAVLERASRQESSPVEVLNVVVCEYLNYALRFPPLYRIKLLEIRCGEQGLESEFRRTFQIITRLVQSAQQAGEFKDGNPAQTGARIVGAIHGLADFLLNGPESAARGATLASSSLLRLLDLFV
jgi:hypothetical protein